MPNKSETSTQPAKTKPVYTQLTLDFLEAVLGAQKGIQAEVLRICPDCNGRRIRPGVASSSCGFCRGTGQVLRSRAGAKAALRDCPGCGGRGLQAQQWCRRCGGVGLAKVPISMQIKVPAGVQDNTVLRIPSQGDLPEGRNKQGDIHVVVAVQELEGMSRRGADVYSIVSLAYPDAILGCSTEVGTVRGQRQLKIPAGTQHDARLTLPGEGVDYRGASGATHRGSHHVTVNVHLPRNVTPVEKAILLELFAMQIPESQQV
ncbi:hypothetical protein WJX74_006997 [Apatococcus lobatus]|uniref:CR-type domain-containing protein n=1 Tax=Apatococcus lobatus TaxID=904363 RepID=A0AAW1S3P7_9CHLO